MKKKMNKYSLISFILSMTCMSMIIFVRGILSDGTYCIIDGDLFYQYLPAIKNMCRDVIRGESFDYSWNISLGLNTSLFNAYYSVYNPFNILFLLDGFLSDVQILEMIIILKTGIAALSFQVFLKNAHKIDDYSSVFFSILYSLCSFQVYYNIINIIWLDAMFVLPFILLGVRELFKTKRLTKLLLGFSYIFITQFYMGYVIGVFSFGYFILLCCFEYRERLTGKRGIIQYCLRYVMALLLSVGISAFVWMPALMFFVNNRIIVPEELVERRISVMDFCTRLLWGQNWNENGTLPNVYCGIAVILMIMLFFVFRQIEAKYKIVYGILLFFTIISCFVDGLYMMWHGFDNPDGCPYRFSFLISFLLCIMAALAFENLQDNSLRVIIVPFAICLVFCLLCLVVNHGNKQWIYLTNIVLLCLWESLILSYFWFKDRKEVLLRSMLILAVIEIIGNGCVCYNGTTTKLLYNVWDYGTNEIRDKLSDDEDIYRVNSLYDIGLNTGTCKDFNSVGYFYSPEYIYTRHALGDLGMYNSPKLMLNFGLTPVTKMILGVRYDVYGAFEGIINGESDFHSKVIKNDNTLSLGFMVEGAPEDYYFYEDSSFANNNSMINVMTGENIEVFSPVNADCISIYNNGVNIGNAQSGNGYRIYRDIDTDETDPMLQISVDAKEVYAYFYNESSSKSDLYDYFLLDGGVENAVKRWGDIDVSYIKELEYDNNTSVLDILPQGDISEASFENVFFATLDMDKLVEAYDVLKENQLCISEYRDDFIKANVMVPENKNLLFTSIPYDKGWRVKVDGVDCVTCPILNDGFLSVTITEPGIHEVEFMFEAEGSKIGKCISLISFFGVIFAVILRRYKHCLRTQYEH
ncbi:MAG: YfhO family protein [Lachnospiraceae bacterium]|nr:YfhO family protein [Lachnospiraceae bacterium]